MSETQTLEAVAGFVAQGRYRRVECDWIQPADGHDPLWAEIRSDLPFAALDALPLGTDDQYTDLWRAIAPHVRAWNALGLDITTGTYQPVPPPAEMGPDAFSHVDPLIGIWIGTKLKTTYREAITGPKASSAPAPSVPTPSPPSAPASDSSAGAKPSRRNRTATTST
jgi:hypothetical protein